MLLWTAKETKRMKGNMYKTIVVNIVTSVQVNICLLYFIYKIVKKGDTLSPVFFSFVLQYAIRRTHENQKELELNRTH
jgi:hypothetical protein